MGWGQGEGLEGGRRRKEGGRREEGRGGVGAG